MKTALIALTLLATAAAAHETAIHLETAIRLDEIEFLCPTMEDAHEVRYEKCTEVKPGFYTIERLVKPEGWPYPIRCIRPVDEDKGKCGWLIRFD